jgi:hypothetical protein
VTVPGASLPGLGATSFTIEFLIKAGLPANEGGIFGKNQGSAFNGGASGVGVRLRSSGNIEFIRARGEAPPRLVFGIPANTPTHVAIVYDLGAGVATGYVNGVAKATQAYTGTYADTFNMTLGYEGNFVLNGELDEVAVYTRALTAGQVWAHAQSAGGVKQASPSGSVFTGWSGGGCSGTGPCVVTVTSATTVTATFTPGP